MPYLSGKNLVPKMSPLELYRFLGFNDQLQFGSLSIIQWCLFVLMGRSMGLANHRSQLW